MKLNDFPSDLKHMEAKRSAWNDKQRKPPRPSNDPAVKARCFAMLAEDVPLSEICARLRIGHVTVEKWLAEQQPKAKPQVAPAPYARGFRWFNTKM